MLNYALLTSALRADLRQYDVDDSLVVGLVRHFWPEHGDYVKRVSAWQKFLCSGTSVDLPCGPLLVRMKLAQVWGQGFALKPDASPIGVYVVNQIAMLFWKEEVPVEPDFEGFINRVTTSGSPDLDNPIIDKLAQWVHNLLGQAPTWDEILGRCGSGATAERRDLSARWVFDRIPLGIPESFYQYNAHDNRARTSYIASARAAAVPKNRKSCRIVASECATAMYAQLGLMQALDKRIQSLGRRVPLRNADIHRDFLRRNYNTVATLDLSDASDYISMRLMNHILPPDWAALCNACRSQFVELPDGSCHTLATYAPMGNGFCFRLLSLVCAGVLAVCSRHSWSDFGDDMICHRQDVPAVSYGLSACGLVLNADKSGYYDYIESCGVELFKGVDITPLKLKRVIQVDNSYADLGAAHRAACKNLRNVARVLVNGLRARYRWNRHYQRQEVRIPVWVTHSLPLGVDGWPGLLRWYLTRGCDYEHDVPVEARTYVGYKWLSLNGVDLADSLKLKDLELDQSIVQEILAALDEGRV